MSLPKRDALLLAGIPTGLLAAVLVFAGYGWLQEHDGRVKAETQTGQQQQQIEGLKVQQAGIQQLLDIRLAAIQRERDKPATASELVSDTAAFLPGLPEPLEVRSIPVDAAAPDGPATQAVVIPQVDFKAIRDAQLSCEEDTARLTACQANQADAERQLSLTEAQRDEWKTAAKGGSMWHRAVGAAKWFAVGAGTGAVTYAIVHHK
jgi:hypothetical protein